MMLKYCSRCRQERYLVPGSRFCIPCNRRDLQKEGREIVKSIAWDSISPQARKRISLLRLFGGRCACCGESNWRFLDFDHINNTGSEHRRWLKEAKLTLFSWMQRYPEEAKQRIQVLCSNCNAGKARNQGVCPHKQQSAEEKFNALEVKMRDLNELEAEYGHL